MSGGGQCSECGKAIPADSPGGYCGQCLLGLGLETENGEKKPEGGELKPEGPGPPSPGGQSKDSLTAPLTEKPGDRIGRYRLLQEIGHGGCGVVYMAEQEAPIRRKVALKVIKLGMDTRQVVARFEAERQALALMDHPNIAKVLDAGATDAGRPYFVMELVGGIKITDYCDQNNLTTRQRLDLFIEVCSAIQHAHQKGIIHRDIKPSNVLVATQDGVPIPKVIDFGIAKATQGRLTDQTLFTAFEQFLGTPAYMSPEQTQLGGLDIDTRSDIYSLGVLLYELLTGRTPFDTKDLLKAGLDEMRRTIREVEPVKPSTRLTQERVAHLAGSGKSEIQNPKSKIDKDLDWIVMKCLEKDRARRYETANGLARDIERHLSDEPVLASPPSNLYRFQKAIRRNKTAFTAAAAVAVMLVTGVAVSTWQAIRATLAEREQSRLRQQAQNAQANEAREREQAQTEAAKSQQVAKFLKDMLSGVGPAKAAGRDTTVLQEILDETAERVAKDLEVQPLVVAELQATIGDVYQSLTEFEKAERMYRESLGLYKEFLRDGDEQVVVSLHRLVLTLSAMGKFPDAEALSREELAIARKLAPIDPAGLATALGDLSGVLETQGKYEEAELLTLEALTLKRKRYGDHSRQVAWSLRTLGSLRRRQGRWAEAEELVSESLAIMRKVGSMPDVAWTLYALSRVLVDSGEFAKAEGALKEQLTIERRIYQGTSADIRNTLMNLTQPLVGQGKLSEAEQNIREAIAIQNKRPESERADPNLNFWFGSVLQQIGKVDEAEQWYRQTLLLESTSAPQMPPHKYGLMVHNLVTLLTLQNRFPEIEDSYGEWLQNVHTRLAPEHLSLATLLADLTFAMLVREKFVAGESMARECLAIREKKLPDGWQTYHARSLLGSCLLGQKKYTEAEPLLLSGYEGMKQREVKMRLDVLNPAESKPRLKELVQNLMQLYEAQGQSERAAEWRKQLEEFQEATVEKQSSAPAAH
ncbi:MAG: serine/threonine-protein kinase [Verrucomicrobia subdivision 3 bacterium]|nr:serine/threonine-protein kinase [Limisphaerales bacterium]